MGQIVLKSKDQLAGGLGDRGKHWDRSCSCDGSCQAWGQGCHYCQVAFKLRREQISPKNIKDITKTKNFKNLVKDWIWENIPSYSEYQPKYSDDFLTLYLYTIIYFELLFESFTKSTIVLLDEAKYITLHTYSQNLKTVLAKNI